MSENKNFLEQMNAEAEKKKAEVPATQEIESFKEESFVKTKRQFSYGPIVLVSLLVISLVAVYFLFIYNPVMSIELIGLDIEQASTWAYENDVLIVTREVYSNDFSEGVILAQSIPADVKLKGSTTMVLDVSIGRDPYELIDVPNFDSTWNRTSIIQWLTQNGVDNFSLTQLKNETIDEDYLITYRIIGATAETFTRSSSIDFTISQVTEESTITMVNFLGSRLEAVDIWALEQNMTYTYEQAFSDIYEVGTVMSQTQLPNVNVSTNDILHFTISKGITDETVLMPTLLNLSHKEADSWLKENGLSYEYSYKYSSIYPEDTVMEQSATSGEEISIAEKIILTISKGEGLTVPNFSQYNYSMAHVPSDQFAGTVVVSQAYNLDVANGQLVSQSVKAGAYVGVDTVVEVIYSLGAYVEVPDFRDALNLEIMEWATSENERGASITITFEEDASLIGNYGQVMYQSHYNEQVVLDEEIKFTIAAGNFMPDFSTMTIEEAIAFSETVSYPIEIRQRYLRDTFVGDFVAQSIEANTEVYDGTYVVVDYSLGGSVLVPNYQGEPLISLETWRREQNELGANITLNIHEEYHDETDYGDIIAQSRYNEYRDLQESIDVIISRGETYHLLNLTYQSRTMIENMAEVNGLNIVFIEVESDEHYSGQVISQEPAADTWISKKDFIYVTIAE